MVVNRFVKNFPSHENSGQGGESSRKRFCGRVRSAGKKPSLILLCTGGFGRLSIIIGGSVALPKILLDTNHTLIVSSSTTYIPSEKLKAIPRIV